MLTDLQEIPILNQVQASLLNLLIVGVLGRDWKGPGGGGEAGAAEMDALASV